MPNYLDPIPLMFLLYPLLLLCLHHHSILHSLMRPCVHVTLRLASPKMDSILLLYNQMIHLLCTCMSHCNTCLVYPSNDHVENGLMESHCTYTRINELYCHYYLLLVSSNLLYIKYMMEYDLYHYIYIYI